MSSGLWVDPHCFDADPDPDPAQHPDADPDPASHPDADPDPDPGGGGGRSAKNVHPPWQNPRYAPVIFVLDFSKSLRLDAEPFSSTYF